MAALDVSTATAILKELYTNQRVTELSYKNAPLYAMLRKETDFTGELFPLPMRVTNPQGRSNTFGNAKAQKTASVYRAFNLTRTRDYSLASISSEAMLASENNAGAFIKLATAEMDGAIESLKRSITWALYGSGSGKIGTVATGGVTGSTITLANSEDITRFEVNQTINIWSAESGGSQRSFAASTSVLVTAVDRDAGTVTFAEAVTGGSANIVAGDVLFVAGDRGLKLTGLAGWIPSVAPTSGDSFFGVDRSVDATRLAGNRLTLTAKPIDEALVDMARRIGREGGQPDVAILGFSKYASLEKTLQQRVQYEEVDVAGISFTGIKIAGPMGKIVVLPDQDCPQDRGYMLKKDSWVFKSLGEPVRLLNADGNSMLRENDADAYEVRIGTYSNLGCDEPKANGVMIF